MRLCERACVCVHAAHTSPSLPRPACAHHACAGDSVTLLDALKHPESNDNDVQEAVQAPLNKLKRQSSGA